MNWYRENRWLGNFLIAFGGAMLLAIWFLFHAKGVLEDAQTEFNAAATERSRLEHLNPFPNEENFRKTQAALGNYDASLNKLKEELRAQTLPAAPIAPDEFQTRLRQAIVSTAEKARTNHVKLPENFHLGFDEFASALPTASEAAALGQELQQVELLAGILIDAKVDALANLKRGAPASVKKTPGAAQPLVERAIVDLSFTASPSALRKVLNQVANSERQFFVVRTLYVRNEQLKGPTREGTTAASAAAPTTSPNALQFIVGNEHVEGAARIELVRFAF